MNTPTFEETAKVYLEDAQLRRNISHATHTIRGKRQEVVDEMSDWEALCEAGSAIKNRVMRHLDEYLLQLEESVQQAGGQVHWARDAEEANEIIVNLVKGQAEEVVKVKSMTPEEIGLNDALENAGIQPFETDLSQLIVQLGDDEPSHILVPAIHKNRTEIRDLFCEKLGYDDLSDQSKGLTEAARLYLRKKFLNAKVGISGANFGVAETGTIAVDVPDEERPDDIAIPQRYCQKGRQSLEERVELFVERLSEYKATVIRIDQHELKQAVTESCQSNNAQKLAVPEGFQLKWLPDDITSLFDKTESPLSRQDLVQVDGVISTCALAIAQTGTIILDAGKGQGRRVLTLLPDYHLCIVRESQIVQLVPEGFAHLESSVKKEGTPVTLISGPSATSDIELSRVEGVHGPRKLEVLVIRG